MMKNALVRIAPVADRLSRSQSDQVLPSGVGGERSRDVHDEVDVSEDKFAVRAVLERRVLGKELFGSTLALGRFEEVVCQSRQSFEVRVDHLVVVEGRVSQVGAIVANVDK